MNLKGDSTISDMMSNKFTVDFKVVLNAILMVNGVAVLNGLIFIVQKHYTSR